MKVSYRLFDKYGRRIRKDDFAKAYSFKTYIGSTVIDEWEFLPRTGKNQKREFVLNEELKLSRKVIKKKVQEAPPKKEKPKKEKTIKYKGVELPPEGKDFKTPYTLEPDEFIESTYMPHVLSAKETIKAVIDGKEELEKRALDFDDVLKPVKGKIEAQVPFEVEDEFGNTELSTTSKRRDKVRKELLNWLQIKKLDWSLRRVEKFLNSVEKAFGPIKSIHEIADRLESTDLYRNKKLEKEIREAKISYMLDKTITIADMNIIGEPVLVDEEIKNIIVHDTKTGAKDKTLHKLNYEWPVMIHLVTPTTLDTVYEEENVFYNEHYSIIQRQVRNKLKEFYDSKGNRKNAYYLIRLVAPIVKKSEFSPREKKLKEKDIFLEYDNKLRKKGGMGFSIERAAISNVSELDSYVSELFEVFDKKSRVYLEANINRHLGDGDTGHTMLGGFSIEMYMDN